MTKAPGQIATLAKPIPDAWQHLFHGAHDPGKVARHDRGADPSGPAARWNPASGQVHRRAVQSEDRAQIPHRLRRGTACVWLHVEATDAKGTVYHLPVDKKGFPGEEYTIAANTLAYQDMGSR